MVEYKDFRTQLTFSEVRQMLQVEADRKYERGEYMWITRHTVLGRWHQIKMEMYALYIDAPEVFEATNINFNSNFEEDII